MEEPAWDDTRRPLAVCMAISTVAVLLSMTLLEWPPRFDPAASAPVQLEISIRKPPGEPETAPRELVPPLPPADALEPAEPAAPAQAAVAAPAAPDETPEAAASTPVATRASEAPAAHVDWYAELERAAAEVTTRQAAEPQSMHPEFDALRRIAALRYGAPKTSPPAPLWKAEKVLYGRTLLKRGNTYMILEDPRLFNRYAFETFERHMLFVAIPLGRARPKNLPWVETIRARYEYMREPDELPPIGTAPKRSLTARPAASNR